MKAIVHRGSGDPGVLTASEADDPIAGAGQIRVRVLAAGLNRADLLQRRGGYAPPPGWPADIPGLEYAGEVESLGDGSRRWKAGDRVMGLVGGGAHAEFVVVHEDEALRIPDRLSFVQAAAIPESFLTAYDALVVRGRAQAGDRVLVHAIGSGLGTAAVQLGRRMGLFVIGTSRTAEKLDRVRAFGLAQGIDTSVQSFRDAVNPPVQVVVDVLGGPALADNLAVLAPRGRLVMLGFLQGPDTTASLAPVLRKRLEIIGSVMRSRGLEERIPLVREFAESVLSGFDSGAPADQRLEPVVGEVFSMDRIADAHRAMEANDTFGKVILEW